MKSRTFLCTLAAAIACTMSLTSCDQKKESKTEIAENAESSGFVIPDDAYYYSAKDRASKTKVTAEKLAFKNVVDVTENEFQNNTAIKELYLQKGFSHVSLYGFAGCTNLEKLAIEGTVDVLNDHSFEGCTSLKELNGDVRSIGIGAFKGCTSLEKVRLCTNLYWINDEAFSGCTNLKSIILSSTITKYGKDVFANCTNVEEASIPSDLRRHMFNEYKGMKNIKKIYLLVFESYEFPQSSKEFPCEQVDLYVPDNLLDQYKANDTWSRFKSILPLSQSEYFTAEGWIKE